MQRREKSNIGFKLYSFIRLNFNLLVFLFLFASSVSAAGGTEDNLPVDTVKVGYVISQKFMDKSSEDGHRFGFGYDYLQNIAYYANWKYEYIDCTWDEALEKIKSGEVDIVPEIPQTPENMANMFFSVSPMGRDSYYVYGIAGENKITSDISSLNGKRIAVYTDSYQLTLFREWVKQNRIICDIVEYEGMEDCRRDIAKGKVDAVVKADNNHEKILVPIFAFNDSNFNIAVAKNRPDILARLNKAVADIFSSSPNLSDELKRYHFRHSSVQRQLSEEETKWVEKHGRIKVGYINNYLPYCNKNENTGELEGLLKTFISSVKRNFDIEIECTAYPTYDSMYEAVRKGEICAFFPIYSQYWQAEELGFMQTEGIVDLPQELIFKGTFSDKVLKSFAVSKTNPIQTAYVRDKYPGVKYIVYDNYQQCFEALNNDKVGGMFVNSFVLSRLSERFSQFPDLQVTHVPGKTRLGIGINYGKHRPLLSIFNKASIAANENVLLSSLVQNSVPPVRTIGMFFREHAFAIIMFVAALSGLFAYFTQNRMKAVNHAKLLADEAREKADIERQKADEERQKAADARDEAEQLNAELEKMLQREKETQAAMHEAFDAANVANEAKTNFLANMSHDIRTPMNAIIGMTAIAGTHIEDKERVSYCLSKITASSKHLLGLINEVLDMSKIEAGKLELNAEEFNLSDTVDNLITMSRPLVEEKGHELEIKLGDLEHELVVGDSQRLQQVLLNLVSNAVKYTPQGGKISFSITEKPSSNQSIGCYEFVIADNGIGMSKDFLPHVFEPFSRAKEKGIEKITGTGLGLSITHSIVTMMNGNIKVESELGKGSTFIVTIYMKLQENAEAEDYSAFADLPILVVDDDEVTCEVACHILESIGMIGEYVLSGEEALKLVGERHEDKKDYFAVIIDWKMPGMDGITTTRELRKFLGEDVTIIIISAYDWTDIELEARAAGANAFISKPLFKSRIVHVFKELVAGENELSHKEQTLEVIKENAFVGRRALLVEDNDLNAEIASEILGMTGLVVDWASDGKQALDIIDKAADDYYDIVFMDIQMPVMDGYEATRAIRSLPRKYTKRLPIIAMTANAFAQDVVAAKAVGMNEHIAKPIDIEQLNAVLKKWL